jgi:hypothetical protein
MEVRVLDHGSTGSDLPSLPGFTSSMPNATRGWESSTVCDETPSWGGPVDKLVSKTLFGDTVHMETET